MQIRSVGIDLGKTTFHLVVLGASGKVLVKKKFSQKQLLAFTANIQTSLIGFACSGAHFLGRALRQQGHDVRLIAAQFVKPFVKFLAAEKPRASVRSITRPLMLRYMAYLPTRVCTGTRKNHIINLRTFLELAHRERWLPVGPERLIHDEEVPQPGKRQPRYIPSAVLDQLNQHLHELRPSWMRMVLILQECGMRINELLQLPMDCLSQDARGAFYIRYLQGKVRREHTIPSPPKSRMSCRSNRKLYASKEE